MLKKKKETESANDVLGIEIKFHGYDEFVEQLGEIDRLIAGVSEKLDQLGEFESLISVTNNHYHLCVNADEAKNTMSPNADI